MVKKNITKGYQLNKRVYCKNDSFFEYYSKKGTPGMTVFRFKTKKGEWLSKVNKPFIVKSLHE